MPVNFVQILERNIQYMGYVLPELMAIGTFLLALVFDFAVPVPRRKSTGYIAILGLLVAVSLNVKQYYEYADSVQHVHPIFFGMLQHDAFGIFFNFVILIGTIISLLLAIHARELFGKNHAEFYLLLVAVCVGGMFLSSASNLLMIYLSLESLSIVSYAMAGFLRRNRKSAEAGIKYVIYGAMASGIMIYGMSYLYGLSGTLNITDTIGMQGEKLPGIATVLSSGTYDHSTRGAMIAIMVMVFSGFLYKIAAVPFHYWSPDVYEGSPTTATGFFSVVPKAAGFAVLIRVLCAFFPPGAVVSENWINYRNIEPILAVLAVLTMTIGNLAALGQTNVKRMLAYSSIAHAGYMLAGLSVLDNTDGPAAVLFYLIGYLFMNLGAFSVLVALENTFGSCEMKDLRGAVRREPVLVVTLCIFLFSLTGLPPLGGFMGKWFIMLKLAESGHYGMIFWIGMNSVVSLFYYMTIAKTVAIDLPAETAASAEKTPAAYHYIVIGKSVMLLILFFCSAPLIDLCRQVLSTLTLK